MAGLIQSQMVPPAEPMEDPAAEAAETPQEQAAEPAGGDMSAKGLEAQMHLDPAQRSQLRKIVLAGTKVMFDEKTHELMIEQLEGPGDMPSKIGKSVAGLIGMLVKESNNSLPPQMMVPAGIILCAHAAEFLRDAGEEVTDEEVGGAIEVVVTTILQQFKIDPEKAMAVAGTAAGPADGAAPAPQAPPAGPAAEQPEVA